METLERTFDANTTRKSYKGVFWFYDFWSWLTESKAAKKVLELAEIRDNEDILEVACGTGIVFKKLVKQNPNGKNVGMDLSPDMLNQAIKRLKRSGLKNYNLGEGNVMALEFPDHSFDLIVNNFMIDLLPEEEFDKVTREFYRLLKPGGRAVISTFSFGTHFYHRFWSWVARIFPSLLTGCRPVNIKGSLGNAGFTVEKALQISQNTFPSEVIKAIK